MPMPVAPTFSDFKLQLKTQAALQLAATLKGLPDHLDPAGPRYNDALLLLGQWQQLEREHRQGVLDEDDRLRRLNRLRLQLLAFIDALPRQALAPPLRARLAPPPDTTSPPSESPPSEAPQSTAPPPRDEGLDLPALDALMDAHGPALKRYSQLYRQLREIQLRRDAHHPALPALGPLFARHLDALLSHAQLLDALEARLSPLRHRPAYQPGWKALQRHLHTARAWTPHTAQQVERELPRMKNLVEKWG